MDCRGALLSILPCTALSSCREDFICTQLQPLMKLIAAEWDCSIEYGWQSTCVPQIYRSTRSVEVLKESSHQSVQMLSSISPSWLSQTRNSLGDTHNWAFPCQVGGCHFSRPRWWVACHHHPCIFYPRGRISQPKAKLWQEKSPDSCLPFWGPKQSLWRVSASLRYLSNMSKCHLWQCWVQVPSMCLGKTQGVLADRMGCTHSSGEEGTRRIDGGIWGFCTTCVSSQTREAADPWPWLTELFLLAVHLFCPCL